MAIANEKLRPAAADVYKQKFGAKQVKIGKYDDFRRITRARLSNARMIPDSTPIDGKFSLFHIRTDMDNII